MFADSFLSKKRNVHFFGWMDEVLGDGGNGGLGGSQNWSLFVDIINI